MLKRYRLLLVAVAGLIACIPAGFALWNGARCNEAVSDLENEYTVQRAEDQRVENEERARNPVCYGPLRVERDAETERRAEQAKERQQEEAARASYLRERRDLCAQQAVADWTMAIGVFSFLGLIILFITFEATRDAVVATRQIGEAQTQAYLSIIRAKLKTRPDHYTDPKETECILDITVKNTGQTPAYKPRLTIDGWVLGWHGNTWMLEEHTYFSRFETIGAGETVTDKLMIFPNVPDKRSFRRAVRNKSKPSGLTWFISIVCSHDTVFPGRSYKARLEQYIFKRDMKSTLGADYLQIQLPMKDPRQLDESEQHEREEGDVIETIEWPKPKKPKKRK